MNPRGVKKAKSFSILVFVIVVLIFFLEEEVTIPVPTLTQGVYLKAGSAHIVTGRWSVPYVYDWDADGRNDLLVGHRMKGHGYVALFRNTGRRGSPVLEGPELLKAGRDYIDLPPEG